MRLDLESCGVRWSAARRRWVTGSASVTGANIVFPKPCAPTRIKFSLRSRDAFESGPEPELTGRRPG